MNRNGWNRYEITCVKDLIRIEINGVETVRFRDAVDASGFIAIQHHGEKDQTYRFRNLFIKELPEIPAEQHATLTEQEPVSIKRIDDKVTLIDFGKVAFGNIVMPVPAGSGTANVHFGEKLKKGRIDQKPPGTVRYGVTPDSSWRAAGQLDRAGPRRCSQHRTSRIDLCEPASGSDALTVAIRDAVSVGRNRRS